MSVARPSDFTDRQIASQSGQDSSGISRGNVVNFHQAIKTLNQAEE